MVSPSPTPYPTVQVEALAERDYLLLAYIEDLLICTDLASLASGIKETLHLAITCGRTSWILGTDWR